MRANSQGHVHQEFSLPRIEVSGVILIHRPWTMSNIKESTTTLQEVGGRTFGEELQIFCREFHLTTHELHRLLMAKMGIDFSKDLSWSRHTSFLAKKARQHLYHLRRLRDFRLPSNVLRNFDTCTIESILMGNITVWFGNSTKQDRQALQRVVCSAERITHTELPDLQTIYYKRCQTKARRIVKDPTHPKNRLFSLLRSGKRFHSLKTKAERLKRRFFPQAIWALNQGN
ncbi:hypothetical protein P4O66_012376 [Electrophorus voltai]|uniref:Alkylated DNA repair protein AlkB homologue 8 N-terminal domain-containing protein n=1 Tax=Electrophorus voltai TaxID=2609070 RepID=A0AAD8Z6L0_9TELE|nr:hypothetical protein P4O66_012376 [Electrophorus voltai]